MGDATVKQATNNEIGEAWTLYILGQLAEEWPRRVDFNAMDLGTRTESSPLGDEEDLFDHLMEWLRDHGLIGFNQAIEGNAYDVWITDRGLGIIGHTLDIEKRQWGPKLKTLAKGAASETGRAAIAETVGLLIGATARGFSGAGA